MKKYNLKDVDPLFKEVVELVIKTRKASATFIQREFDLGYARSAKILDEIEQMGIIGQSSGVRGRDILIKTKDLDWNKIDEMVKKAVFRQKIIDFKRFLKRAFRVLTIVLFLYILKLIFGFEVVLLFGLAVIIEYLVSARSFYSVF